MIRKFFEKIASRQHAKEMSRLWAIVGEINKKEEQLQTLSETEFLAKTAQFKEQIATFLVPFEKEVADVLADMNEADEKGELDRKKELSMLLEEKKKIVFTQEQAFLNTILPDAFAVVKNGCRRLVGKKVLVRGKEITWDMIPFDVQLIGGIVLHEGKIAEMRTGEGKTLVATLPIYLNALTGKGVHLVTVNDYLAQRDAEWMGFLYKYLGLTVGVVLNGMGGDGKREAYGADITYGTNNEFGFDYLRDNMAQTAGEEGQRALNFAIVDEVDSILIDEARTPLIISSPAEESTDKYVRYSGYVKSLQKDEHYVIDEKMKTATLTEAGIKRMEEIMGVDNIYTERGFQEVHHIEQSLKANAVYKKDVDYIVKDGEVLIVDEFTGRVLAGRRYSDGLHQAIEAKESVEVKRESRTFATITFQNYFRLFRKLAGMTGTAMTEAEEFAKIYKLEVVEIPTNRDMVRIDKADVVYKNELGKFKAIVENVKEKHSRGQPVLVGTIAIEKSEFLSHLMKMEGIPHTVLNAKFHEKEAEIIAAAGQKGAVTIATNMAGRGTDIKLGEGVTDVGGLVILGSERHESRRIDNQLRGRAGRQGDPGESQFYISLEDDLMRVFGGDRIKKMMEFLKIPEDMPIETKMISNSIESSQRRVEGYHFDVRKHVVEYDDVMNKHREIVYSRRRKILHKKTVRSDILEMVKNFAYEAVMAHAPEHGTADADYEAMLSEIKTLYYEPSKMSVEIFASYLSFESFKEYVTDLLLEALEKKEKQLPDPTMMRNIERAVYLRTIDMLWMDHLDHMQALRDAVSLQGYGQKDPLVEYKKEGFLSFEKLLGMINRQTVQTLFRLDFAPQDAMRLADTEKPKNIITNHDQIERAGEGASLTRDDQPATVHVQGTIVSEPHVGRNDPCPCGAKKEDGTPLKYKQCHGKNEE